MTWRRSRGVERCGNCRTSIAKGVPLLELRSIDGAGTRVRCQACAPAITAAPVPTEFPDETASVSAPGLPIDGATVRKDHGFVSAGELQRRYGRRFRKEAS